MTGFQGQDYDSGYHDGQRYGVVRYPLHYEVIDKAEGNRCVFSSPSRELAHKEADRRNTPDPFPLLEETDDPGELPTVGEWLEAGSPMREVTAPEPRWHPDGTLCTAGPSCRRQHNEDYGTQGGS